MNLITFLATLASLATPLAAVSLNVTATAARKGSAAIECWEMSHPLFTVDVPGAKGSSVLVLQGESTTQNITYVVQPSGFDAGLHAPPGPQWAFFISGAALLTLPNSDVKAYLTGGEYGVQFAADFGTPGHRTQYPSTEETVTLIVRVNDVPAHHVVRNGPCVAADFAGLHELAVSMGAMAHARRLRKSFSA